MTVVNIIQHRDAVHILTDGGCFDEESGNLVFQIGKVWPLPHLNAVIAIRGRWHLGPFLIARLGPLFSHFDEMKCRIDEFLSGGILDCETFDLVVSGWSESTGPTSYFICNHNQHPGVAALQIVDLAGVSLLPGTPAILDDFYREFPSDTNPHTLDPLRDGLRMLEIQRRHELVLPGTRRAFRMVGGFAQLTTVTNSSISTRIIHRWPDKVGMPVADH